MTDIQEAQAKKYVSQHLEPQGQDPREVPEILSNPTSDYKDILIREGSTRTPFFEIEAQLESIDTKAYIDKVKSESSAKLRAERPSLTDQEWLERDARNFGKVLSLSFRLENNDNQPIQKIEKMRVTGDKGDLEITFPSGVTVMWNPLGNLEKSGYDPDLQALLLAGDITSPEGLFVVLHELDHAEDLTDHPEHIDEFRRINEKLMLPSKDELAKMNTSMKELWEQRAQDLGPLTPTDVELFLRSERNAHAAALKKMASITSNQQVISALQQNIHGRVLQANTNLVDKHFTR